MSNTNLLVIWKDPNTRQRFIIAELWHNSDGYYFAYKASDLEQKRSVSDAIRHGFVLFPAFKDLSKLYFSNNLFPTFTRRLPSKNRPDYKQILDELKLPDSADEFQLLEATEGYLPTDTLEFIKPAEMHPDKPLELNFFVAGFRYYNNFDVQLSAETGLRLESDTKNEYDPYAVKTVTLQGAKVGYVPAYYSRTVDRLLSTGNEYSLRIISYDPSSKDSSRKLKVKLVGLPSKNTDSSLKYTSIS